MNDEAENRRKNPDPWISLFLGIFIFPGYGRIYNGKPKQGIFLGASLLLIQMVLLVALFYFSKSIFAISMSLVIIFLLPMFIVVPAFFQCKRPGPPSPRKWYGTPIGIIRVWVAMSVMSGQFAFGLSEVFKYFVKTYRISSSSMSPTLLPGDMFFVRKAYYGLKDPFNDDQTMVRFRSPQRGDIIVFKYPKDERKDFIKRVIGVPGDTVEVRDKEVYLNGKRIDEPYVVHDKTAGSKPAVIPDRDDFGPVSIPADSYFVMGDNRDHSLDSRFWGPVSLNKIKGVASMIYASRGNEHSYVRWKRIGKTIE
jgi:signal peptidase I